MAKLIVTKKGADLKHNDWIEGQEITCHENLAEMFKENGFCVDLNEEKINTSENEGKPKKLKNK
jgi:hypothetical protein